MGTERASSRMEGRDHQTDQVPPKTVESLIEEEMRWHRWIRRRRRWLEREVDEVSKDARLRNPLGLAVVWLAPKFLHPGRKRAGRDWWDFVGPVDE